MERNLVVSIREQKVSFCKEGAVTWQKKVSTSKFGVGFEEGSYKTPLGQFVIAEKIGENEPLYTLYKGRKAVGIWDPYSGEKESDCILTRILWLEGLDPENKNTKERYIYFHGTNQEALIGTPASHGCVRLRNKDMLELYDMVEVGDCVQII